MTDDRPVLASRVESVRQSPLNERVWVLALDCGHDVSITANRRPQRKMIVCWKCKGKARGSR